MDQTLLTTPKFSVQRREYVVAGRGPVRREMVVHPGAVLILPLLSPTSVVMDGKTIAALHVYRHRHARVT